MAMLSASVKIPCAELLRWLTTQIQEGDEVLDVGCGTKWYWDGLIAAGAKRVICLDAWEDYEPDVVVDLEVNDPPFSDDFFDIVLILDVIEHLSRPRGERLLAEAFRIARRQVILLTPQTFDSNSIAVEDPESDHYGNPYNYHRSLWTPPDFSGWEEISNLEFTQPTVKRPKGYFLGVYDVMGV